MKTLLGADYLRRAVRTNLLSKEVHGLPYLLAQSSSNARTRTVSTPSGSGVWTHGIRSALRIRSDACENSGSNLISRASVKSTPSTAVAFVHVLADRSG